MVGLTRFAAEPRQIFTRGVIPGDLDHGHPRVSPAVVVWLVLAATGHHARIPLRKSQTELDGLAHPFVTEVAERTGESCSIALLDETDVVSIAHTPSPVHKVGFTFRP